VTDLLKDYLRFGSPLTLVVAMAIALIWLFRRPQQAAPRRLLAAVLIGYWALTTRVGAELLAAGIIGHVSRIESPDAARGADTVVVLSAGSMTYAAADLQLDVLEPDTVLRVLEAARVAKLISARLVIASGGRPRPALELRPDSAPMADALAASGVRFDRILQESQSTTTHEQAQLIRGMLVEHGARRFVLVTSPTHMRRSLAVFRAEGLDPIPSMARVRSDAQSPPPWWLPNKESMRLSDVALYDYAANVYYWLRGWTRTPA
jgi:uncharacterized SAM-binding protein YcdF (DUF218 family)